MELKLRAGPLVFQKRDYNPSGFLKQQEKNRAEARTEQERIHKLSQASELKARINSLNDKKRDMTIKMTEDNVSVRQMNAFEQVIEGIDAEIAEKKTLSLATPTKSNRSPSNN